MVGEYTCVPVSRLRHMLRPDALIFSRFFFRCATVARLHSTMSICVVIISLSAYPIKLFYLPYWPWVVLTQNLTKFCTLSVSKLAATRYALLG